MTTNGADELEASAEGHIFHRFDDELQALIELVGQLGDLATAQISDAGKAIKKGDVERARQVLDREKEVDALDVAIDEEIHRVLAVRQPMAKDLRILLTVNRIGSYLERVGDQACEIAKLALALFQTDGGEPDKRLLSGIPRMAKYVHAMLGMSIRAFQNMDIQLALEVIEMNRDLNEQFDTSIRSLTTYVLEDPRRVGAAVQVVLGLRSLDRVGGHAMSVGCQVIFMVKGMNVRHQSPESLVAEIRAGKFL